MSRSVAAFCRSRSCVLKVMSSSPSWLRISTVLRKRRCRAVPLRLFDPLPESLFGSGQCLWGSFLPWMRSLEEGRESSLSA